MKFGNTVFQFIQSIYPCTDDSWSFGRSVGWLVGRLGRIVSQPASLLVSSLGDGAIAIATTTTTTPPPRTTATTTKSTRWKWKQIQKHFNINSFSSVGCCCGCCFSSSLFILNRKHYLHTYFIPSTAILQKTTTYKLTFCQTVTVSLTDWPTHSLSHFNAFDIRFLLGDSVCLSVHPPVFRCFFFLYNSCSYSFIPMFSVTGRIICSCCYCCCFFVVSK